jgi:hypothetical protein
MAAAIATGMVALTACGGGAHSARPAQTVSQKPAAPPRPAYTGHWAARVLRRTRLHTRPDGRVVATIGRRTEWRSPRYLAVTKRVGAWVGVITAERPNGHVSWMSARDVELVHAPATIRIDLSEREARVTRGGRTELRFRIAIGQPDTPTPKGRFGVTDALTTKGPSSAYGCCILALSAHQPNIAQGWTGGDRIAIHATPAVESIGTAASNGCMRTTDAVMRRLFEAVTLGATVFVRA